MAPTPIYRSANRASEINDMHRPTNPLPTEPHEPLPELLSQLHSGHACRSPDSTSRTRESAEVSREAEPIGRYGVTVAREPGLLLGPSLTRRSRKTGFRSLPAKTATAPEHRIPRREPIGRYGVSASAALRLTIERNGPFALTRDRSACLIPSGLHHAHDLRGNGEKRPGGNRADSDRHIVQTLLSIERAAEVGDRELQPDADDHSSERDSRPKPCEPA